MFFNVNFNVFFNLIKVHLLVSELHIFSEPRIYMNASRISELLVLTSSVSRTLFLTIWGG